MIQNWDIISHLKSPDENRSFTLVIDGTEQDARLISKKLAGYVQTPEPAEPPFTYSFVLPPNLDEDTLAKIRTAVREGVEQANKINQFVPGGTLGNPLFGDHSSSDEKVPSVTLPPEDSFFKSAAESAQPSRESKKPGKQGTPPQEITVSDKDMLIKDMEATLLGKMPLEDIFSAETKYGVVMDIDNQQLVKKRPAQPAAHTDVQRHAADAFDIFEQQEKDSSNVMDLEDLHQTPGDESRKHHSGNEENKLPDNLSVHSFKTDSEAGPSEANQSETLNNCALPEEMVLGDTVPPMQVRNHLQNKKDGLPDIAIRNDDADILEKTFNLETTLSPEVMRTQYEKSFRTGESLTEVAQTPQATLHNTQSSSELHPAQTMLHLRRKDAKKQTPPPSQIEEPAEGKTILRLRKRAKAANSAPQKPQVQTPAPAEQHPSRVAPQTVPVQQPQIQPAVEQTPIEEQPPTVPPTQPVTPPPSAQFENPKQDPTPATETPNPVLEKTKTIDHSIELPLSELKKHNWPLEVPLLPTYTLENLVLSVNRFAHATAISVIDNPGKMYNPLVFHGTTGTGKTHFLNAMAYGFSKKYGQENIFMTNGVRLSRGIQRYVLEGNIEKFEKFMDSVKVLLIDDIHLLAINEQNRAHVSKLLNKFLKEQKQIVITSKYPPESLEKLEELIQFRLDSGWISELKTTTGNAHLKIVKTMLIGNGVDLSDTQINQFFGHPHMTLSTIVRSIRRLKVLENLVFPQLPESQRSQADMLEKLLATTGEDPRSEILEKDPSTVTSINTIGNGEWGRLGFFYPSNSSKAMNWMVYAIEQRAKELGINGGFEIAVRSSYSTENIISSAFKIANLCDNKKLRGAVILGPALTVCEPSIRENFYDILTHMLEIMLIRCGIINTEALRLPSTYVKVISELLR